VSVVARVTIFAFVSPLHLFWEREVQFGASLLLRPRSTKEHDDSNDTDTQDRTTTDLDGGDPNVVFARGGLIFRCMTVSNCWV
jgi:hypothetical protein